MLSWSEQGQLIPPLMTDFFEVWSCSVVTLRLPNTHVRWSDLLPHLWFTLSEPPQGPPISPCLNLNPFLTQSQEVKTWSLGKERIMEEGEGGSYENTHQPFPRRPEMRGLPHHHGDLGQHGASKGQPCPGKRTAQHLDVAPASGGLGSKAGGPSGRPAW